MSMNLRDEKLPPASVEPIHILAGLYRSTFVEKMRERFRLMLSGAYAIYITVLGEEPDLALKTHLSDVLHDIAAHAGDLVDAFEEELMRAFRAAMERPEASGDSRFANAGNSTAPEGHPHSATAHFDSDLNVQEFIARSVRGYDTRYGSIILALTKTCVKLTDQSVEHFRPPWTPAKLFSAFSAALDRIGIPIHARVRLALYKMFAQEVLRHLGDGCMDFRYALPHSLANLNKPSHESDAPVSSTGRSPTFQPEKEPPSSNEGATSRLAAGSPNLTRSLGMASDAKVRPVHSGKFVRLGLAALGFAALMVLGWWAGVYLAKARPWIILSGNAPVPLAATKSEMMTVANNNASGQTALDPNQAHLVAPVGTHEKREALRNLKLKNFVWGVAPGGGELLFTLTLVNANLVKVAGVEVVCSQYSASLDFLEAAKTVLPEPIEAGQSRTFRELPIGSASEQADRVNCVVADLDVMAP